MSPLVWGAIALLLGGFAFASAEAVAGMTYMWNNSPMYSYGWLVPGISLFLLWARREALARVPVQPAPRAGAALLLVWLLLLLAGRASGILLIEQMAMVLGVAALVLALLGGPWLRAAWAPVAYLLLAVPLWDGFTEPLHFRFQNLSALIGVRMLDAVGIPAIRTGTFLELPNLTLEVARACSGVNYLVAVLALGLPLSYLYLRTTWRRIVLVVTAIVIAAISNSLRVALIGVLAYLDVGSALHGPMHVLHGLFVAGIGHVALFVGLWWLGRQEERRVPSTSAVAPPPLDAAAPPLAARVRPSLALSLGLTVLLWSGAGLLAWYRPAPVALASGFGAVPTDLAGWTADPLSAPAAAVEWQGADQTLSRRYVRGEHTIDLFIAYYEIQRQAKEIVSHRVSDLHRDALPVRIALEGGESLDANAVTTGTGTDRTLTLFWYELDGTRAHGRLGTKLRLLWHALGRRRTNGAVISLRTAPGPDGAPTPEVQAFVAALQLALGPCLPGRPATTVARAGGHEASPTAAVSGS